MPRDPLLDQSMDQGGPQMPTLKAGQRLFNRRYELKQLLGAGGMGVVWLARDHTEEIEVALKFLPSVLVLQEREMRRLREEVRAGKELRHPRLVATYGMEIEDGIAAIVMEFVPGQTLRQRLDDEPRGFLEPEEISGWVKDVCDGLSYLHEEAKRIHRDLKPANVIIDGAGRAKLMDFGISHRIKEGVSRHSKTGEGQASGSSSTLAYASPQQLSGKPSDRSDDIYSLGATLYELLTGTPPFYRGGLEAVALQIKTESVTPVLERRQELVAEGLNAAVGNAVPQGWERTVVACLEKEREKRHASAGALWQALQTPAKVVRSLSSPPPPTPDRTPLSAELASATASDALKREQRTQTPGAPAKAVPCTKAAPFENSLGMRFVPVPIGAGPSRGHRVLFGIWETRSKDYAAFIKERSHDAGEDWRITSYKGVPVGRGEGERAEDSSHPVVKVSWEDATAFAQWLTRRERDAGRIGPRDEYRLPTDVEWSYAVGIGDRESASASPSEKSGGMNDVFPWGGDYPPTGRAGNYADSTMKAKFPDRDMIPGYTDGYATTAPAGSFAANRHGLHDLGGNVWEWCQDWYDIRQKYRVLRGGSWSLNVRVNLRSAYRDFEDPRIRDVSVGFRCVLVVAGG